ncbi:MAG: hypothetical protein PHR44_08110 [Candidatus Omnitrophica bacterium]|nr:hypothetical protein [Candidatus Omnitrophota bacterium]
MSISVIKKSGQALTELALFGTALFLVIGFFVKYGTTLNYNHGLSMQVFRQSYKEAYDARNDARTITYARFTQLPVPDPGNPLGLSGYAERTPFVQFNSAVWTQKLFYNITWDKQEDLPRVIYDFGDKRYTFTTAGFRTIYVRDGHLESPEGTVLSAMPRKRKDIDPKKNADGKPVFFEDKDNAVDSRVNVRQMRWVAENGDRLRSWEWEDVAVDKISKGDSLDLDGDGEEESVLSVENRREGSGMGSREVVDYIRVIDSQEGEVWQDSKNEPERYNSYWIQRNINSGSFILKHETLALVNNLVKINGKEHFIYPLGLHNISPDTFTENPSIDIAETNTGEGDFSNVKAFIVLVSDYQAAVIADPEYLSHLMIFFQVLWATNNVTPSNLDLKLREARNNANDNIEGNEGFGLLVFTEKRYDKDKGWATGHKVEGPW